MKELMLLSFILSAPATGAGGDEGEAYRHVAEASYKASGLEAEVNRIVEAELRNVPDSVKRTVSNVFLVAKTIQERKVSYTWSF